jgi:hypothetical protein
MRKYISSLFLCLVFSCHPKIKTPESVIEPQKMEQIMWDYLKASAYSSEVIKKDITKNDSIENVKIQKVIFDHYGVTKTQFYNSYQYYISNPKLMTPILDSITSKQNKISIDNFKFQTTESKYE